MLKLLYSVACENVIVAEGSGTSSLINILERIEAEVPSNAPDKVLVAKTWSCIAFWTRGQTDFLEPVTFEQRTLVISPDGQEVFDIQVPFVVSNQHVNYRNVGTVNGFPVTTSGIVKVEVFLRKQGDAKWKKFSEFPIIIERKVTEVTDEGKPKLEHPNNEIALHS